MSDESRAPLWSGDAVADAVLRAGTRAARLVQEELRDGLGALATVAAVAPLLGLLATVVGIPTAFVGCDGEKSICMAAVVERLSVQIWPTAMGLLIGLVAHVGHSHFERRLTIFEREMRSKRSAWSMPSCGAVDRDRRRRSSG